MVALKRNEEGAARPREAEKQERRDCIETAVDRPHGSLDLRGSRNAVVALKPVTRWSTS